MQVYRLKGNGGLTHGRDFNEMSYLVWVLSRPVISKLDLLLREMTKVDYQTPEQSSVKIKNRSLCPG